MFPYLPVISYVHGAIAHPQVWSRKVLQDDESPPGLSHGRHDPAVPQQVPVNVAVDVVYHSAVDVVRLTALLLHTHQHCLAGILPQEVSHTLQHVAKVPPLVRHPVMEFQFPVDVTEADVQVADACTELGGQAPGLALSVHPSVQGHGVVGPGQGDLRQRLVIRDAGHPGRVEELRVGRVIIIRSLNGSVTQTDDSKYKTGFHFSCSQRMSRVGDLVFMMWVLSSSPLMNIIQYVWL